MSRHPAEKAQTAYWRREVSRDAERMANAEARYGYGSPEHVAEVVVLAESKAKLAEAEAAYAAAIRGGAR